MATGTKGTVVVIGMVVEEKSWVKRMDMELIFRRLRDPVYAI